MPNTVRPQDISAVCDYRSDDLAKEMLANIIGEKNFDIDDIEWDDNKITVPENLMSKWQTDVDPVTIDELTERKVKGSGVFDAMMHAIRVHLKEEYDNNRITGAEYATTYTRLTEAALGNAVQFCLQKNQAYFQGILAQAQAITAGIQAQIAALTAKVQLAKVKAEALGVAANYALTTMKIATEDAQHALTCKQQAVAEAQIALTQAQAETQEAQTRLTDAQSKLAGYQARYANPDATDGKNLDYLIKAEQLKDTEAKAESATYQAMANSPVDVTDTEGNVIPNGNIDFLLKLAQKDHIDNQMEVEDQQQNLYKQQIEAYKHKSEKDVAEVFSNAYLAMKSIEEGLAIPKALSGASINEVLQNLKTKVDLGRDSTNITTYSITTGSNASQAYSGVNIPDPSEEGMNAERAYLQYGVLKAVQAKENLNDTEDEESSGD